MKEFLFFSKFLEKKIIAIENASEGSHLYFLSIMRYFFVHIFFLSTKNFLFLLNHFLPSL